VRASLRKGYECIHGLAPGNYRGRAMLIAFLPDFSQRALYYEVELQNGECDGFLVGKGVFLQRVLIEQ